MGSSSRILLAQTQKTKGFVLSLECSRCRQVGKSRRRLTVGHTMSITTHALPTGTRQRCRLRHHILHPPGHTATLVSCEPAVHVVECSWKQLSVAKRTFFVCVLVVIRLRVRVPTWFNRPVDAPGEVREAVEHAECCICFDALCEQSTSVLTHRGRRTCGHFFHSSCCESFASGHHGGSTCPICRADFDGLLKVPSIEVDPEGWFKAVDVDGNGRLSQEEVREVLKAQLSVDWRKLEEQLPMLWRQWDRDGDGTIDRHEMIAMARYMKERLPRTADAPVASIESDKHAWFAYFDEDHSGTLEKVRTRQSMLLNFDSMACLCVHQVGLECCCTFCRAFCINVILLAGHDAPLLDSIVTGVVG